MRDGVPKRSQHRELSCKLAQLIATGHEAGGGAEHQREGAKNALRAKGKGDGRSSGQRDTKAQPLGHQSGEPPWAAVANAQSRRGNQKHRGPRTGTATHQKTTGQTHGR